MTHVNFHIGAPRVAADLIKDTAKVKSVRSAKHLRVLKSTEYQAYFRGTVNASKRGIDLLNAADPATDTFWTELRGTQVLVASQHAMLGHPDKAFDDSQILPQSEKRVERLSNMLSGSTLDLHLTISNQRDYLSALPAEAVRNINTFSRAPSWYELAARIEAVCPDRRLIVWDFTKPEKVALPFVLAMFNLDDGEIDKLKKPVRTSIAHSRLLSKVFQTKMLDAPLQAMLGEQFQQDLNAIDAMRNTVLIRSDTVPKEFIL